jgi:hypothetical protein
MSIRNWGRSAVIALPDWALSSFRYDLIAFSFVFRSPSASACSAVASFSQSESATPAFET